MGDEFPKVKLAAAQVAPVFLDREATVKKTCEIIEEAGENGANIIGFPEAFIPTFPYWVFFETPLEARKKFVKLFKNAVVIPSKATDQICNVARKANIYAVVGINEREPNSMGTLYNTLNDR